MTESNHIIRIGIISDTHGLLRPEAIYALQGVELIIHAGDIDSPEVLNELGTIAPVKAVRGNMDKGVWTANLPKADLITHKGLNLYVLHDLQQLDLDPQTARIQVVVNGHTHRPLIQKKNNVLYFNPGSAGYRRNSAPLAIGILKLKNGQLYPEIIKLNV
ncbi:MAG: metallophosphoesterase family protein [Desulfobacteraceae bacterium]